MASPFECPVCLDPFECEVPSRQPLALPCGHTFCRSCLVKVHPQRCPTCRCEFSGDAPHMAVNFALRDAMAMSAIVKTKKAKLSRLSPDQLHSDQLAGEKITQVLAKAPGNDAAIGGIKAIAPSGWFAARPSGTEAIYKIYAESFKSKDHLQDILAEAQKIVDASLGSA
ncbi:MAG: hypothetical protein WDW36_003436 [Sanguina aurantia]